jgi:carboxypeptidase family protein
VPFLFLSLVLAGALSSEQAGALRAPTPATPLGNPQAARISGRVVEDGTNAPLSGVSVTAIAMERGPVVSPPTGPSPQTITAEDGRYMFDGLAPGRYRIDAQKAGFASPLADPAASRTFEVAAGQTLDGVNFSLPKGAVIAGQILDPSSGEPLANAMVMAMRRLGAVGAPVLYSPQGPPRLMPAGQSAQTNDLGEFRIFGLPPGEYFVASSPRLTGAKTSAASGTAPVMTFYPGTTDALAAQPVIVAAGQVATGIVFRILSAQTYKVSGIVVDAQGAPVEGATVMLRNDPRTSGFGPMPAAGGRSDARGHFVIGGVTPGSYMAMASVPVTTRNQGGSTPGVDAFATRILRPVLDPNSSFTVTDANVDGVQVVVHLPQ